MDRAFTLRAPNWCLVSLVMAFACVSARGGQEGADPYTDPVSPPRLWTEGEIRAQYKDELELLKITTIPRETDTLVPGAFLNIDEVPGLKGVLRGTWNRAPLGEDGQPLYGAWATDLRWSPSGLPRAPTIQYGVHYVNVQDEAARARAIALTVKISHERRSQVGRSPKLRSTWLRRTALSIPSRAARRGCSRCSCPHVRGLLDDRSDPVRVLRA